LFVDFQLLLESLSFAELFVNEVSSTPTIEGWLTETTTEIAIKEQTGEE
jgi:hypothetical protein